MSDLENAKQVLDALSKLDLSQYPCKEIKELIGKIGNVGGVIQTLHENKIVLRARPNYNGEHFSKVSEISYKPAQFNKTFQRASTPDNTMFYGSTISEEREKEELNIPRVIGLFEALPFMRDKTTSGEQVITYSRWRVVKDIPLVSIIHHKDFKRDNSYARKQREDFEKFLADHPKEVGEKAQLVADFLANEFAKDITPNDYDYLISAIYTEMATNHGLAGVFYPSVRTGGEGFNVAIHPKYIDAGYLVPEAVGECTIYKREANSIIDNDTQAEIQPGATEFVLKPVDAKHHVGREVILKQLYPENYK